MQNDKLYIANVPFDTTEEALRGHFANRGGVLRIDLPDEAQRGKMRSLACVTMTSPPFANAARPKLDGVSFVGRVLRVSESRRPAKAVREWNATGSEGCALDRDALTRALQTVRAV